jgi:hypothetical protein
VRPGSTTKERLRSRLRRSASTLFDKECLHSDGRLPRGERPVPALNVGPNANVEIGPPRSFGLGGVLQCRFPYNGHSCLS